MWFMCLFISALAGLVLLASITTGHLFSAMTVSGLAAALTAWATGWLAWRFRPPGRPTLRIDAKGLRHSLYGSVDWVDVIGLDVYQNPFRKNAWFFHLATEREGAVRTEGLGRLVAPASKGVLEFALVGLDFEPADVHAAALYWRDRAEPPRSVDWVRGMTRKQVRAMRLSREVTEMMGADLRTEITEESSRRILEKSKEVAEASEDWLEEVKLRARHDRQLLWFAIGFPVLMLVAWLLRMSW